MEFLSKLLVVVSASLFVMIVCSVIGAPLYVNFALCFLVGMLLPSIVE